MVIRAVKAVNEWFEKNQPTIRAVGRAVGEWLVKGFRRAWGVLRIGVSIVRANWCPDLLSVLYPQFALLIVGSRPKRICKNCGTLFPLRRGDSRFCCESCYRMAYNHAKANTT